MRRAADALACDLVYLLTSSPRSCSNEAACGAKMPTTDPLGEPGDGTPLTDEERQGLRLPLAS
ncbi:MAG: hypothetical protein ACREOE_13190 [Gemmatimonadales bacterium]